MIPLFKVRLPPTAYLLSDLLNVFESGYIGEGDKVEEFERRLGEYIHQRDVLAVSSGTAALHIALKLCGVGPGDEVITTAMTAEPTNLAIRYCGADVVWADVDEKTGNISPASVYERMTERTKAIMAVDYGGIPCNYPALRLSAPGIPVIEDAAHAFGQTGGDIICYSFQAIKQLTTGDGGAIVLADPRYKDKFDYARRLRWFGLDRRAPRTEVDLSEVGWKYNMGNVAAAIGLRQLETVGEVLDAGREHGWFYECELANVAGIETYIAAPEPPAFWMYTVLADRRGELMRKLKAHGVDCGQVHRRNDLHSLFAASRRPLPGLDSYWGRMLHIPVGWWMTDDDVKYVCDVIRGGW